MEIWAGKRKRGKIRREGESDSPFFDLRGGGLRERLLLLCVVVDDVSAGCLNVNS